MINGSTKCYKELSGGQGENHRPVASHWHTLSHNVVHLALVEIPTNNISGDSTDCIGSCKSNYHTITATTVPFYIYIFLYIFNIVI
jgi:hypothetical protein